MKKLLPVLMCLSCGDYESPPLVEQVTQAAVFEGTPLASGMWTFLQAIPNYAQAYVNCWDTPDSQDAGSYTFTGVHVDWVGDYQSYGLRCSATNLVCTVDGADCAVVPCIGSACPISNFCALKAISGKVEYEHMELGCVQYDGVFGYADESPRYHARAWKTFTTGGVFTVASPPRTESATAIANRTFVTIVDGSSIKEPGDGLENYSISDFGDPKRVGFRIFQSTTTQAWKFQIDRANGGGWETLGTIADGVFSRMDLSVNVPNTSNVPPWRMGSFYTGGLTTDKNNDLGSGELGSFGNEDFVASATLRYKTADNSVVTSERTTGFKLSLPSGLRQEGTTRTTSNGPLDGYATDFVGGADPNVFFGGPGL